MKKFGLLPRAEKISSDSLYDNETIKDKRFGIKVNVWVFIALFLILIILMFTLSNLFYIMFGAVFILGAFNKSGKIESNDEIVRNTMWSRLPFLFAGIFVEIIAIFFITMNKKGEEQASRILGKLLLLFIVAIVLVVISRLIFLIACICAVSKRKKVCTDRVSAEPDGFVGKVDISEENADLSDPDIGFVYKYFYQGEYYRFIVSEGKYDLIFEDGNLEVYIDPDQPDRYYSKKLFMYRAENLKLFIKSLLIILIVIFFSVCLINMRIILDFFIEKY